MIVGNVEQYIFRCLSSFFPVADEVVLVRAIGGAKPDDTFKIADHAYQSYAQSDNGRVVPIRFGQYKNKPENADWPHVDDFAAARNASFALASHDWCFWCDSDDVLEKPEEAAKILRELADKGGACGFVLPYKILGRHIEVPRERLIFKRAGTWRYAVHEAFEFYQPSLFGPSKFDGRVTVTHLPGNDKQESRPRNIRILKSLDRATMPTGLLYHLHLETLSSGDLEQGVEIAKEILERPDLGRAEKFETFVNLAKHAEDDTVKTELLHQAYAADPRRREALFLLTNHALNMSDPETALAYSRQMMATPEPPEKTWNQRTPCYTWAGDEVHTQALRANGRFEEAERIRQAALIGAGGPKIALIHATRGRPEQASQCRKAWMSMAEKPEQIEHIFCIDANDPESVPLRRMHHVLVNGDGGCVAAWNAGAFATTAPILIQLSDDWTPPALWDRFILERIGDASKPSVLAVSDGHRDDHLLCMAICTRNYFAQDYFLFHPWFKGVYSDNWFTEQAYKRKQVIEARDLVFNHHHPAFDKSVKIDPTYALQNSPERYEQGAAVIADLRCGIDWSSVPGFFNYWQFYEKVASLLPQESTIAEIGVWLGRSIIFLAQAIRRQGKRAKLYAVDTFKGAAGENAHVVTVQSNGGSNRNQFERNLERCGVRDMVEILEGDSAEMAWKLPDGPILDFCFIDAAHDFESVQRDVKAWSPKVKSTGMIAGHDAEHDEVFNAVKSLHPNAKRMGCIWLKS